MPAILKPNVDLAEAERKLSGPLRGLKLGKLQSVIDFYIPYLVFDVAVKNGNKMVRVIMAIDSVTGQLDPYTFDTLETTESRLNDPSRIAQGRISEARAQEILEEKIKRNLYLKGFFKVRDPRIESVCLESIYIPYWVGIYRRNDLVRLKAISAISGLVEGTKVEEIIVEHFRATGKTSGQ